MFHPFAKALREHFGESPSFEFRAGSQTNRKLKLRGRIDTSVPHVQAQQLCRLISSM